MGILTIVTNDGERIFHNIKDFRLEQDGSIQFSYVDNEIGDDWSFDYLFKKEDYKHFLLEMDNYL